MNQERIRKYIQNWKTLSKTGEELLSELSEQHVHLQNAMEQEACVDEAWGVLSQHAFLPSAMLATRRSQVREALGDLLAIVDKGFQISHKMRAVLERCVDHPRDAATLDGVLTLLQQDLTMKHAILQDIASKQIDSACLLVYLDAWQATPFLLESNILDLK